MKPSVLPLPWGIFRDQLALAAKMEFGWLYSEWRTASVVASAAPRQVLSKPVDRHSLSRKGSFSWLELLYYIQYRFESFFVGNCFFVLTCWQQGIVWTKWESVGAMYGQEPWLVISNPQNEIGNVSTNQTGDIMVQLLAQQPVLFATDCKQPTWVSWVTGGRPGPWTHHCQTPAIGEDVLHLRNGLWDVNENTSRSERLPLRGLTSPFLHLLSCSWIITQIAQMQAQTKK